MVLVNSKIAKDIQYLISMINKDKRILFCVLNIQFTKWSLIQFELISNERQ